MHAQILAVDLRGHGQHVKRIHKLLIHDLIVQVEYLLAKVERFGHVSRLVVPTQQENSVRVLELHAEQVSGDLRPIVASVYVVPHEHKLHVFIWVVRINFAKHGEQVEELAVDIAYHDDFSFDSHQVWFSFQNVLRSAHYVHQAFLRELAALLQIVLDQLQLDLAVGRRHRQHALETERFDWRRFDALNLPIVARVWQAVAVQYLFTLLSDFRSSLNHIENQN